MDKIGLIGISWRQGGPDVLARFTVPGDQRTAWLRRFAETTGLTELVYLATCNRIEIVFVSGGGESPPIDHRASFFEALVGRKAKPGEAEKIFQIWRGEGAIEHLFLTASGLDSARVGEVEINGQVRDAYEMSRQLGLSGPRLDLLFEETFKVARRVHRQSSIGEGKQSLAEIALDHLRKRLERTPGPVAFIGVSAMTVRCARAISGGDSPVFVVNRTFKRAEELALEIGAQPRGLEDFRIQPDPVEAVVLATGSAQAVLGFHDLERLAARTPSGEPPLVIDLAIPPDVLPEDADRAGIERIGMTEVLAEAELNRERRLSEAEDAIRIVDQSLIGLRRRLVDRVLSPLFAAVQRRYRFTAIEGVERLFKKELSGLGETEKEAVRHWAETLARRFAHLPTAGLRGVACEFGTDAVEAFLSQADESMIKILREASDRADITSVSKEEEAA